MSDKVPPVIPNLNAVEELAFEPSDAQRVVKSQFWAKFYDDPRTTRDSVNLTHALDYTQDGRLTRWWKMPGFADWFCNKEEWRQRQEYLVMLAQETAEKILKDPRAPAAAKVNLIKFLTESIGRAEARTKEVKMLDASINSMNPEQLAEYIKANTKKIAVE